MQIDPANIKKWNVIYPVYINSKKTVAEGRRISATKACENPTCIEIGDCCSYLKIPFAIEVCQLTIPASALVALRLQTIVTSCFVDL